MRHKDRVPVKQRLLKNISIDNETGCWNWTAALTRNGYGKISVYKGERIKTASAHKEAYLEFVGAVPDGIFVCHKCDNRRCINPSHMFLGTAKENTRDMIEKGRNARKLNKDQVIEIRQLNLKQKDIAFLYGVSQATINFIKTNRNWKNI